MDFIAIDFETANSQRNSACAVGLAFVKDNQVIKTKHFYIRPPEKDKFDKMNMSIHGIKPEDVMNSPSFDYLWTSYIGKHITNNIVVFHNTSMERSVLEKSCIHYSLDKFILRYIDTMLIAKRNGLPGGIVELCQMYDIKFNHHNPESDAKACAEVFLKMIDSNIIINERSTKYRIGSGKKSDGIFVVTKK